MYVSRLWEEEGENAKEKEEEKTISLTTGPVRRHQEEENQIVLSEVEAEEGQQGGDDQLLSLCCAVLSIWENVTKKLIFRGYLFRSYMLMGHWWPQVVAFCNFATLSFCELSN